MAEIRKHDPAAGNAIAEALRAAMGDPVRPVTTWQEPSAAAPPHADEHQDTDTRWVTLTVATTPTTEVADDE